MMKMFKTMNKEKNPTKIKEKEELKKGTKKGLPNNLKEIYLIYTYVYSVWFFIL